MLNNEQKKIGEKLVKCNFQCGGIVNDPKKGIIPRCLIYEATKQNGASAIVVGINPGKCGSYEKEFYLKNGCTYNSLLKTWDEKIKDVAYYKKGRVLLKALGFTGDILWTDLAKCECRGKNGNVPVQTLRVCIEKYLDKEIKTLPKNFTIIAFGNVAFNYCSLRFPERFVLGLPHPTGAWGKYNSLLRNIQKDTKSYLERISIKKDSHGYYKAVKLFD